MRIYIDMEMPKSCRDCRFCNGQANTDYGTCDWCDVDGKARDAYTMQDCPLVPVPKHGDLIDRDDLKNKEITIDYDEWDDCFDDGLLFVADLIDNAPVIIPASEEVMT